MDPFVVDIDELVLDDLRRRLRATRWPARFDDPDWLYGVDGSYLRELCDYWAEEYEWRADEARINVFEQWLAQVDGQTIHFIHRPSPRPNALPLLILHGWPCSVLEFLGLIDTLAEPSGDGQAFHVVVPSLPGFGFSTPVAERGTDARRCAELFVGLMAQLGYLRFATHAGDFGAIILTQMAARRPDAMIGMHLTMGFVPPVEGAPLTERDRAGLERLGRYQAKESAYSALQKTTPHTLGFALNDSPSGQAAWIVERFRNWSDCGGDVESVFTKDELLANITLYWVTATAGSSGRLYHETEQTDSFLTPSSTVPVGYADLAGDTCRMPQSWLEDRLQIVHWRALPRGGHFPAMEVPEDLVGDIRAFYGPLAGSA